MNDVHNDIENHFEILFKALHQRKENLIHAANKLSQELRKFTIFLVYFLYLITLLLESQIEIEKKELSQKIQATTKMLESGALLFDCQRDTALGTWKVFNLNLFYYHFYIIIIFFRKE